MPTSRNTPPIDPSGATAELFPAGSAKALVISIVGQLVADGRAQWSTLESGDIEVRFDTGETFLLADTAIVRLA